MSEWSFDQTKKESPKRGMILLQAAIFTPLTLLFLAGVGTALYHIATGDPGYVVLLVVAGILAIAVGVQAVQFLLDARADSVITEGEVTKKWTKGNLFFFFVPSYYIAVSGKIFAIKRLEYAHLLESDQVRVRHYPHSLTVEVMERYDTVEKRFIPADGSVPD